MFKDTLQDLVKAFADQLVALVREASLSDLMGDPSNQKVRHAVDGFAKEYKAPVKASSKRLVRRTPEQITALVEKIASLLAQMGDARAEQIRLELNLSAKELPRILKAGVEAGAFCIVSGQKRSTTYGIGVRAKKVKAVAKAKTRKPVKAKARVKGAKASAKTGGKKPSKKASAKPGWPAKPSKLVKRAAAKPVKKASSVSKKPSKKLSKKVEAPKSVEAPPLPLAELNHVASPA